MSSTPAATNGASHTLEKILPNASAPATISGPTINGKLTVITILSPDQLATTPLLIPLVEVTNEAFGNSLGVHSIFPPGVLRLRTTHQIVDELRSDAVTFTCIVSSPYTINENGTVNEDIHIFGTATGKHYQGKLPPNFPEALVELKRKPGAMPVDEEHWELLLLAVNIKNQKQGLATFLVNLVEQEVRRRFDARQELLEENEDSIHELKPRPRHLRVLLNTVKDLNEQFYLRLGYETTHEQVFPTGTYDSKTPFTMIDMGKLIC